MKQASVLLEVCAQSYQAAMHASEAGAKRIELCIDLPTGGLTPDPKLIQEVLKATSFTVFVLIRNRPGHFVYSRLEIDHMCNQIKSSLDAGAHGIVCGALLKNHTIDQNALDHYLKAIDTTTIPVTFHRAIEQVPDTDGAIETLLKYKFDRILTGGKKGNAYESRHELKTINEKYGDRIKIVAGSGVTSSNVKELIECTGVTEVHTSAKYGTESKIGINKNDSDPNEVKRILSIIDSIKS